MPTDAAPLSLIGAVVDLQRQSRRQATRNTAGAPIWEFDTYTITGSGDTTHTLSYLPYGINVVLLNGLGLVEGTDYSCDYTTGVVTITATLTAGDILHVRYVTTGDLIVGATTPDTGVYATDTFNRADSSTTLGTTSDGLFAWTVWQYTGSGVTWGIASNQARLFAQSGAQNYAYIDPGHADGTVQVDMPVVGTLAAGASGLAFRQASDKSGWVVWCASGTSNAALYKVSSTNTFTQVGSNFTVPTGASVQAVLNGSSITVNINATTVVTATDSFNATATRVGMYCEHTAPRFDNFTMVPL